MTKFQISKKSLLGLTLFFTTVFLYIPHLIYFNNAEEYSTSFLSTIQPTFIYGFIFIAISLTIIVLLPLKVSQYICALILVLSLLSWIQADILHNSLGLIDGSQMSLKTPNNWLKTALLLMFIALTCLVFRFKINHYLPFVISLVIAGQLSIVFYSVAMSENQKINLLKHSDDIFNYSPRKNIIVIVLDTFGSEIFDEILATDKSIVSSFNGFVQYPDTTSNYPATYASIPSILTGQLIPFDKPFFELLETELPKQGLPLKMEEKGFKVTFVSVLEEFRNFYQKRFVLDSNINPELSQKIVGTQLIDYALFRTLPDTFKPLVLNQGKWLLSSHLAKQVKQPSTHSEKGMQMLELFTNNSRIVDSKPQFKILHFLLPHPEYVYDQNCEKDNLKPNQTERYYMVQQSTCTLKKLALFFNQLKKLNVYNQSMIVVTSDHGARLLSDMAFTGFPSFFELNSSGVLFMLKGINQNQPFIQIDNPYTLLELKELILDDRNHHSKLDQLKAEKRPFYAYWNNRKGADGYLPDAPMYQVNKNYKDPSSWKLHSIITTNCQSKPVPITMKFDSKKRSGFCSKHGFANRDKKNNGSWTRSTDARILFKTKDTIPETNYLLTLELRPYVNSAQTSVDLTLELNNKKIYQNKLTEIGLQKIQIKIAGSTIKNNEVNELKLLMPDLQSAKTLGLKNDSRKLGVFLKKITITGLAK